ncbi:MULTISPECIES: TetR family transcriptional regulator [unclassified Streptomyces]|uniref:TetR family transcriptional regulator n=1 Tax=Streptomyces TaxID=1883 RepID=UPI0001C19D05|nr:MULTISPECIES: TetR family transcriptional regulator [unclassified Streptomyces]MYR64732.1 TetR family transcriptional regulator [Streptomyces sp. SID4939]MYS01493.1 TetR family transcriptional regulator [Streptomyces sp. SID4940]MYT64370.1 TetR family transcriptional regulator [Streptomyces sp. SID8357]MYT87183.1 TetR family transcriptional regulator [Streptomyces sp. SID8360]MYU34634.1 TetR family transcriptional regulator [Streptomyces sp. SID8358]MYW37254.1 TetR family transcriptional r
MTSRQTSGAPLSGPPAGLRERKKRRTREALLHAALELFDAQGYERTTVDEIVEAVDVSQRTFFRYFANKEAAAFAIQDAVDARFLLELRQRPSAEAPFEALRRAALNTWRGVADAAEDDVTAELRLRTYRMIESTPALVAAHMRRGVDLERRTTLLIAEREGLDPETDPRPGVAVAAFAGVMRLTGRLWGRRQDANVTSLREMTELHLGLLHTTLLGPWRS